MSKLKKLNPGVELQALLRSYSTTEFAITFLGNFRSLGTNCSWTSQY